MNDKGFLNIIRGLQRPAVIVATAVMVIALIITAKSFIDADTARYLIISVVGAWLAIIGYLFGERSQKNNQANEVLKQVIKLMQDQNKKR